MKVDEPIYILFGEDACRIIEDNVEYDTLAKAVAAIEDEGVCLGVIKCTSETTPQQLLEASQGFFEWTEITEEEYLALQDL